MKTTRERKELLNPELLDYMYFNEEKKFFNAVDHYIFFLFPYRFLCAFTFSTTLLQVFLSAVAKFSPFYDIHAAYS